MKNENGLYPHQEAVMDSLKRTADRVVVDVVTTKAIAANSDELLRRTRLDDMTYGGGFRPGDMIVIEHKLHLHEDVAEAPPMIEQPNKRSTPPSMMLASMMSMVAGTAPNRHLLDDPFAALERRVLSREEALEAFKTSETDKTRAAAAEAKRARKAAKLKSQR